MRVSGRRSPSPGVDLHTSEEQTDCVESARDRIRAVVEAGMSLRTRLFVTFELTLAFAMIVVAVGWFAPLQPVLVGRWNR